MKALVLFLAFSFGTQRSTLPVLPYKGRDANKPLLLYISGDGGLHNYFSATLLEQCNQQGYSIVGFNAKMYFRSKKNPEQTAADAGAVAAQYLKAWNCNNLVLIGYSFGADVVPFIQRRWPPQLSRQVRHIILMSPSRSTDFQTHVLEWTGLVKTHGLSVPAEINKLTLPTTLIFGTDEKTFPLQSLTAKNLKVVKLPGGHHYRWDINAVVEQIKRSAQ